MRKHNIIVFSVILLLLIGLIIYLRYSSKPGLYVNGIYVTNKNVSFEEDKKGSYAKVPVIPVLKKLGADVAWKDDETAEIVFNGTTYVMDLESISICKECSDDNLIQGTPGGCRLVYEVVEDDIVIDDMALQTLLFFMHNEVIVNINSERGTIRVHTRS